MFWVMTPPEETDWHVGRDDLVAMLEREWPGAEIKLSDASAPVARDVVWHLRFPEGELDGSANRAGQAHYLEGPLTVIARFASWWRGNVPAEQPLILTDESYSAVVNLNRGVTEQDIVDGLA